MEIYQSHMGNSYVLLYEIDIKNIFPNILVYTEYDHIIAYKKENNSNMVIFIDIKVHEYENWVISLKNKVLLANPKSIMLRESGYYTDRYITKLVLIK